MRNYRGVARRSRAHRRETLQTAEMRTQCIQPRPGSGCAHGHRASDFDKDSAPRRFRISRQSREEFKRELREREERLRRDMLGKLGTIEGLVSVVEERSPQTVKEYRERLEARLRDILADRSLDEQRVITEAAIFADRTAVDEETVRLRSHIAQFRTMLEEGSPIGRKMDFLVQEFNRESNTIGSKCSDASLAKVVVDLKSEIEKIREQLQNVE